MSYQKEADETKIVTHSESVPLCSAVVGAVLVLEHSDPKQTTPLYRMVVASSLHDQYQRAHNVISKRINR